MMGGNVTVASVPGKGSVFTVRLAGRRDVLTGLRGVLGGR
jgi:signal transduction histidine kinase